MAGEIGHVVYGARMLAYLGDKVQDPAYWAGTLFPDIRHTGVVSRYRTHPLDVTLDSLVGTNDFVTGMRVHSWIDATREKFLRDANMKESLPWHPFVPHALKLVEDELLYDKYDDWNLIYRVLGKIHEEEVKLMNDRGRVGEWHRVLQDYFKEKPTDDSRTGLSLAIGLSQNSASEINSVAAMLKQDGRAKKMLEEFLEYLERVLQ